MWTVGHSLARSQHLAECVWDSMDMVPGHLTQAFSRLLTHYTQPWVIRKMGWDSFPKTRPPVAGDALRGSPCPRRPRNGERRVRTARESCLSKLVPLNVVLSDLIVHSTHSWHVKCLGSAPLPPCSMCSPGDKDESWHLAVGCTSCSKHRVSVSLDEKGADPGTRC